MKPRTRAEPMTFDIVRGVEDVRAKLVAFAYKQPTPAARRFAVSEIETTFREHLAQAIRSAAPAATRAQAEAFAELAWNEGHHAGFLECVGHAENYAEALAAKAPAAARRGPLTRPL